MHAEQNFEIISTYTDREAIEDGMLVAINGKDRVSRACWELLVEKSPKGAQPPNCWPVAMLTWFQCEAMKREEALKIIAKLGKDGAQKEFARIIADRKALALSTGLIESRRQQAQRTYDDNTDGGIFKMFAILNQEGLLGELSATQDGPDFRVLWLMPNENKGITLMLPEDY